MSNHIEKTIQFVKEELQNAEAGHDWWHIERVWKTAKNIAKEENVNLEVVEFAALLHDIADAKFHDGDEEIGPRIAGEFLNSIMVNDSTIIHVQQIIRNMSFKSSLGKLNFTSPEMLVVQDADRLDAIGAIGIARAFTYGGFKNRELYNPKIKPDINISKEAYKKSTAPTINHFYEKLLLLKDKMNTTTGKKIAAQRHEFMEQYLQQFYAEWNGEK
ncbi:MAG: HD domain-containing protein [Bacteroidetes bacterium]|nr:HD domain-containing protein [Bacteroidota bacterium]MBU1485245.1 HD domain-containing protein [Bacteroidota bacterium]MBU2045433.1 HD domain-containing protein [Bacteroidota bacterium]MBU2267793.1 HD domain-containing protein [Bacteroidota bacterium]MBU2375451.1 HD domain-containing protein [Bacteroidota bacterium]